MTGNEKHAPLPNQERSDREPDVASPLAESRRYDAVQAAKGWGRRAAILTGTAPCIGLIVDGLTGFGMIKAAWRQVIEPDVDEGLLRKVFGVGPTCGGIALAPAHSHPFKSPPPGMDFYPIEADCCVTFNHRFLRDIPFQTVLEWPNIRDDDTIYSFGSQVSNLISRRYLGNPKSPEPIFDIERPIDEKSDHWRTSLWWNLHTPHDAPTEKRYQFGDSWETKKHVIVARDGTEKLTRTGKNDYLLLTVLPRHASGKQRVFIFGGIHGPGTRATSELLFRNPREAVLHELCDAVAGQTSYYQALFDVKIGWKAQEAGKPEYWPTDIKLIDAKPLKVLFR